jgi:hypothetical protein
MRAAMNVELAQRTWAKCDQYGEVNLLRKSPARSSLSLKTRVSASGAAGCSSSAATACLRATTEVTDVRSSAHASRSCQLSCPRALLLALLSSAAGLLSMTASAQALEISKWEAGTCTKSTCTDAEPATFYTQAAGHPDYGITDFAFSAKRVGTWEEPEGHVKDVRVDLPPGLAVNPEATEKCSEAQLEKLECPEGSQVGEDEATGTATVLAVKATVKESFPVYNMARKPGQPARFAVELKSVTLALAGLQGHIYLEGAISWHDEAETSESSKVTSGDYHEFFKIEDIPTEPEVIESRLIFWGIPQEHQKLPTSPPTAFITLPSTCSSDPNPTTTLHVDSWEESGNFLVKASETPVPAAGCDELAFNPSLSLTPETSQSDQPDGLSADLHVPQSMSEPSRPDSPDVQNAEVTLPEGMTLNPSAANGLQACSDEQFGKGECPAASKVGSFGVNAPGIPDGSLDGGVYVGSPEPGKGPETGGMYRIFLLGEAAQYGVGLRLEGRVRANAVTGRVTTAVANAPQVPLEDLELHFTGGARTPLANPLACGPVAPTGTITPYGGGPAAAAGTHGFTVEGNGAGGACASPLPFSLLQSLMPQSPAQAGAYDPATFNLTRDDGQQYLSSISTTLPPGLVGAIPSVPLCKEAEANAGTCPATSQIGTVTVAAGAGSEPYTFAGRAYLTGPYDGAPYGLSVVVPAVAGPYDLGEVVTRAGITVGLYSGRVTVTSTLPSIVGGVPLRLRSLSVAVNRPNFLFNPTSCGPLATESLLTSTFDASQSLASPFQVGGCGALPFKPAYSAQSGGKTSKLGGASIEVKITQGAHQANIREVQMQLPSRLVVRFSTLQKACLVADFEAGIPPGSCQSTAKVGTATVLTPVLPGALTGSAYLVSHADESFPDLDLVLQGDGVQVVLVGHTHIAHSSITTSTFESLPDVPISSVTVNLPVGANSLLAANGRLCATNLLAPTTIIAQSGARITQDTTIAVTGCAIVMISHRVRGTRMILTIWAPERGRLSLSGHGLATLRVRVKKAGEVKLSVPLSGSAMAALHSRARKSELRISFVPSSGHNTSALTLPLR